MINAKETFRNRSVVVGFPDPATGPFSAFGVDVPLFARIPYPQDAPRPGLVLFGDQWAMDRLQNSAAVEEDGGHSSHDQPGASPDAEGAC